MYDGTIYVEIGGQTAAFRLLTDEGEEVWEDADELTERLALWASRLDAKGFNATWEAGS